MSDFLELSLTLKLKPIIMENVAPSIKYIDFLGYVCSEFWIFSFHLLDELCFSMVSELKNKGKICSKKINVCV